MLPPRIINFITIGVLAASLISSVEPTKGSDCSFSASSYNGPKERFIVLLDTKTKRGSDPTTGHYAWLKKCLKKSVQHISTVDFSANVDKNVVRDFSVDGKIHGYSAWFDKKFVKEQLSQRNDVTVIEKDAPVKVNYAVPRATMHDRDVHNNPNPNLDRIDQQKFPLDKKYNFPSTAGNGVNIYVVDTGVLTSHSEFQGRATFGGAFCDGCPNTDDNGHGSHVSGIAAGKTFGVAKNASIIGVKVLAADGSGSNSFVINGLTFVLTDHEKQKKSSVVNLSLGGAFSAAVNQAVKSLTDAGVHVAVAAGNDGADACGDSPSSEPSAVTVGATEDTSDAVTDFSNIGKCVDIFAPGRNILSVGIKNNKDTAVFSGTSQATPHVAGTLALIIAKSGDSSPASMAKNLVGLATKNVIPNPPANTVNVFLRVPAP